MKPTRLLFLASILLAIGLLQACSTTSTTSATGAVTKVTVPDKDFTTAIVAAATTAAQTAIPAAVNAYVQTHQPKSALAAAPAVP